MELKFYDKSWLPAFKGGFLIIFGILAMLQITGTITSLAIFFSMLIGMIGILLIAAPILFGKKKFMAWSIINGIINLAFAILLIIKATSPRTEIVWIILVWIIFYAISECIEAGIMFSANNAFGALTIINALLSLLLGYALYLLLADFVAQKVFNIGLIALVFGVVNELSAYLLSRIKEI
jgi:uncharacterized membrane protein HdeD (DUF308 family)